MIAIAHITALGTGGLGDDSGVAVLMGRCIGLHTGQTDLRGGGKDIIVVGHGIDSHQTDILDVLSGKLSDLPAGVASPIAIGNGTEVLTVVGDLDVILGDGAVEVGGLPGLITQTIHSVGLAQLKLDPVVGLSAQTASVSKPYLSICVLILSE